MVNKIFLKILDDRTRLKAEKRLEYSMNKAINMNKRENILKSVNNAFMLIGTLVIDV